MTGAGPSGVLENLRRDTYHVATIVDLNFMLRKQLTRHYALEAGYQMLYVSGLEMARQNKFPNSGGTSDIFLSGYSLGLTASW